MGKNVNDAFHCLVASMDIVTFHSSATATKGGMVFSAPTVSISEFNLK